MLYGVFENCITVKPVLGCVDNVVSFVSVNEQFK